MASGLFPEFALLTTNLYAPAGTRIPMAQPNPPLGWTSDTSSNMTDCSMRINSGTGNQQGGSTSWSAWNFGGSFNINTFTLSVGQLPAHNHGVSDPSHSHNNSLNDLGHTHGAAAGLFWTSSPADTISQGSGGAAAHAYSNTAGNNSTPMSINNAGATTGISTQNTGSGSGIQPNYTTPQVKFCDHIMSVKS